MTISGFLTISENRLDSYIVKCRTEITKGLKWETLYVLEKNILFSFFKKFLIWIFSVFYF